MTRPSCAAIVMTAMNYGYGAVYLTPNHMVDFSAGAAVVRFDMSTLRRSDRDWTDIWITPYEDSLQLPLEDWLPVYAGESRRAVHVRMDNGGGGTIFRVSVVRDFESEGVPSAEWRSVLKPRPTPNFQIPESKSGEMIGFAIRDSGFGIRDQRLGIKD